MQISHCYPIYTQCENELLIVVFRGFVLLFLPVLSTLHLEQSTPPLKHSVIERTIQVKLNTDQRTNECTNTSETQFYYICIVTHNHYIPINSFIN